jgi:hypothetical protein
VAAVQAAENANASSEKKPRQDGEISVKGGRGRVNKVKARAVEQGKKRGIGKRTIERSLAKANGSQPSDSKKRQRRTKVETQRDKFLSGFMSLVAGIAMTDPESTISESALDLLTKDMLIDLIEDVETAGATLNKVLDQLRAARARGA